MRSLHPTPPPRVHAQLRQAGADYKSLARETQIRRTLWDQQHGLCAYCEKQLPRPDSVNHRTKIEHFHPQNTEEWTEECATCSNAASTLDASTSWKNLLLVCEGRDGGSKDLTCDSAKGNTDICSRFRNPKIWTHSSLATVDHTGRLTPVTGLPAGAAEVIDSVLNLNAAHLVNVRRAFLVRFKKQKDAKRSRNQKLTRRERDKLAASLEKSALETDFPTTYLSFAKRLRA